MWNHPRSGTPGPPAGRSWTSTTVSGSGVWAPWLMNLPPRHIHIQNTTKTVPEVVLTTAPKRLTGYAALTISGGRSAPGTPRPNRTSQNNAETTHWWGHEVSFKMKQNKGLCEKREKFQARLGGKPKTREHESLVILVMLHGAALCFCITLYSMFHHSWGYKHTSWDWENAQ